MLTNLACPISTVVPKLFRTVTQIKVAIMFYYPQQNLFAFYIANVFSSDRS